MDYKLSFYNINVFEEGYTDNQNYQDLYYNTLSNQFAHIPKDVDVESLTQDKQAELKEKRMIVPKEINQAQIYRQQQQDAILNDYPNSVRLTICTTMKCNYQCDYCMEGCYKNTDMTEETLQDMFLYIENELNRHNLKHFHIQFFGGEPLLRKDIIKRISNFVIPLCDSKGISYDADIITNGYFFDKETSEELKLLRVVHAQITIDGFEDNYIAIRKAPQDAYKRVIHNIENSVIPIQIRINTAYDKQDEVITLFRELSKLKSVKEKRTTLAIYRVNEYENERKYGFTDEEWLKFRERIEELNDCIEASKLFLIEKARVLPCNLLQKRNVFLCTDGNLYRCINHLGKPEYAIGTIKKGIIENETEKRYVCSVIDEMCMSCKLLPICKGNRCRYEYYLFGKKCDLEKTRFKQNMQNYLKYVF